MVKRTLIAIAVIALVAATVQAADPAIKIDTSNSSDNKKTDLWPWQYVALDLCEIPVYMEVGMYVQLKECNKREIKLKQVDCGDLGHTNKKWPCYKDCDQVEIRANFDVKVGVSKDLDSILKNNWAGFEGGDTITGSGSWQKLTVCVEAAEVEIWESAPGDKVDVGSITITVKPQ